MNDRLQEPTGGGGQAERSDKSSAHPTPSHEGPRPAPPRTTLHVPRLSEMLAAASPAELDDMHRFWNGGPAPESAGEQRASLVRRMSDPATIETRAVELGRRLSQIVTAHVDSAGYQCRVGDLSSHRPLAHMSKYELEAAVHTLAKHGFLVECRDGDPRVDGQRVFAVPLEIGDGLLRQQRARRRGVFDSLTLRGFLDRHYDDPARAKRITPTRLRELYKMYSNETAAVARIERAPEELRKLVEKAVLQFGGLLSRGLYERLDTSDSEWNGGRWKQQLEESLLGTVERLELARYGIAHADDVLIVFNEIALAWLKRVAVPSDPDRPDSEAALGVDLASNISRFMGFLIEHHVRFTVRGEIFKTTEKRILQELIPNPGRELEREDVLDLIFRFTRAAGLIESTGERTFAIAQDGRNWEQRSLEQKLAILLEFVIEERGVGGDYYHQIRQRRIFMRLLKRVEPLVWYDLMYLPFLARNTYLSSLDQLAVDEYFASRQNGAHYTPMEDPQRMAWNLARWVRTRLHLLGLVDLGYDKAGRPVALRLTRTGAKLVGVVDGAPHAHPLIGSVIVTPDFEVVLFPTGDDAELVHELDRFCVREKMGETLHFRVSDKSVHRALSEGMTLARMLENLRTHSRTPVPQNVLYSIRDWGWRAGVMTLDPRMLLRCEDADTLRRLQQDPGVKTYVREALDDKHVQLKTRIAPRRMCSLLREFGYLVELEQ